MGSRRLTFYLMRTEVETFDDALAPDKTSIAVPLADSSGVDGRFHYVRPRRTTPAWVSFVQPILAEDLGEMRGASASGLLITRSGGRIFALTFGYGRSLLDLSKIEFQFGLRVALNRIDPRQLRSLDTKTFEDMVVSTNTQVSRSAELPTFRVDISTDILRAATGEPRDASFAKRLSGSDALVMNVDTEPADLPSLCEDLLRAFGEDHYKSDFEWIDQLALVRSTDLLDTLNEKLVADLADGTTSATHLAVPEAISWEDIDAFKITGTLRHEYDDLDLDDYLDRLGEDRASITLQNLKSRRVSVRFSRSGTFDDRWNLYRCIVTEQRVDGALYVLIEGRWFAVNESLVEEVDRVLSGLREPTVDLIPARSGEVETEYNDRLARSSPTRFLKLDARIKRPGGASSGIELCDVLSSDGAFIHVKRKSRSSTLSHLFAQGSVSAATFVNDGHFRDGIREAIREAVQDGDNDLWLDLVPSGEQGIDRSRRYCVTYAVVANSKREGIDWLPFFSKLNLMQHSRQLIGLGFDVALTRVPVG